MKFILILLVLLSISSVKAEQKQNFKYYLDCIHENCNTMQDECFADKECKENSNLLSMEMRNQETESCRKTGEELKTYYPGRDFPTAVYQECLKDAVNRVQGTSEVTKKFYQCKCQCSEHIDIEQTACKYTETPLKIRPKVKVVDEEVRKQYDEELQKANRQIQQEEEQQYQQQQQQQQQQQKEKVKSDL